MSDNWKMRWAWYRANGFKRCICGLTNPSRLTPWEKGERRAGVAVRGERCRKFVSRQDAEDRGAVVCTIHWEPYQELQKAKSVVNRHLRDKYDPGPLPLDGESEKP